MDQGKTKAENKKWAIDLALKIHYLWKREIDEANEVVKRRVYCSKCEEGEEFSGEENPLICCNVKEILIFRQKWKP